MSGNDSKIWGTCKMSRPAEFTHEVGDVEVTFDVTTGLARTWLSRYHDGSLHEPALTMRLVEVLDSDSVFYDVGSNIGYFSVIASALSTDGSVHAFDVDERFMSILDRHIARNDHCADVHTIVAAVGSTDDTTIEYSIPRPPTMPDGPMNLLPEIRSGGGCSDRLCTDSITLDAYAGISEYPDIIKLDVEGYEYRALDGAWAVLEEIVDRVFVEIHPEKLAEYGDSVGDVIEILDDHGYRFDPIGGDEIDGNTIIECTKL